MKRAQTLFVKNKVLSAQRCECGYYGTFREDVVQCPSFPTVVSGAWDVTEEG